MPPQWTVPDFNNLTTSEIAFLAGGFVGFAGYVVFILVPAWSSYGRVWERVAASFLTLYMLAAMLGIGAVLGLAVVAVYANFV